MSYSSYIERVLNEDDNIVYHASPTKFEKFEKTNDIGFHFGTKEQAIDRMKQQHINDFYIYSAKLDIKNPMKTLDKKTWFGTNLLDILTVNKLANRKDELATLETLKQKYKEKHKGSIKYDSGIPVKEWNEHLKEILYKSGHDAIIYTNKYENKKIGEHSYIVFDPKQIKILNIEKHTG